MVKINPCLTLAGVERRKGGLEQAELLEGSKGRIGLGLDP